MVETDLVWGCIVTGGFGNHLNGHSLIFQHDNILSMNAVKACMDRKTHKHSVIDQNLDVSIIEAVWGSSC